MTYLHRHATAPPTVKAGIDRPPLALKMEVICVQFRRGEGCCDQDPVRLCRAYYTLTGELLAVDDTFEPEPTESATT